MTDGDATSDDGRKPAIGVNDHVVLEVRFVADHDSVEFRAKHGTELDHRTGPDLNRTVSSGIRCFERRWVDDRVCEIEWLHDIQRTVDLGRECIDDVQH